MYQRVFQSFLSYSIPPRRLRTWLTLALAVALVLVLFGSPNAAHAATLTVTNNADSGPNTLRALVTSASPGDVIVFQAGLGTITLATEIAINTSLDIQGPGATAQFVSGGNATRIFNISGAVTVNISGLTLSNGNVQGANSNPGGGAILTTGATLTLTDMAFTNNSSTNNPGANAVGGALDYEGAGSVTINGVTFSGNSAVGAGGAIENRGAVMTITNSTFNGNSVSTGLIADGGAIRQAITGPTPALTIINSTFAGNSAVRNGGNLSNGGGTITLRNTIVAGGTAGNAGPDLDGPFVSADYNLVQTTTGFTISGTVANNLTASPNLGGLANNGGQTDTMALLAGSPAIDHIPVGNCAGLPVDQRNLARPSPAGGNCDIGAFELQQSADLSVTKTVPATVNAGNTIIYTLTVNNGGPTDAQTVSLTDAMPANTSFVSTIQNTGPGFTCTNPPVGGTGTITCTRGSLAPATPAIFTIVVAVAATVPDGTVISNTAAITSTTPDPNLGNNTATVPTTVISQADLSITKTDGATTYTPGAVITYTIMVSNAGPLPVSGATVADTIPGAPAAINGASWTCAAAGGATCTAGPVAGNIADTINIPVGGTATYTLTGTVDPTATGGLSNTATVATPAGVTDTNPNNNTATDTDGPAGVPQTDLSITKTDGVTTYTPGAAITYTIVVTNPGPGASNPSTVTDTPPAAITGVTWTCAGTGGATCTGSGTNAINDAVVNLPVGGTVTYLLSGTVAPGTTGSLSNIATVSAATGVTDTNPVNNTATDTDAPVGAPQADLSITKTDGATTYTPGAAITYTIVVTNNGPSASNPSTVADTPPAAITGATWTCSGAGGATCTANGTNAINDSAVNLPVGGTVTYSLTGTVAASTTGNLTNTATVTAAAGVTDTNPANNAATDTDTPPGGGPAPTFAPPVAQVVIADPVIAKFADLQLALPGETVNFTITVHNQGGLAATNVIVVDTIPDLLVAVGASTSQGTFVLAGNMFTFNIGTVNPGQTVTISIQTRVSRNVRPPVDVINTAVMSFAQGAMRTATTAIRVTQGNLPSTGEHPADDPQLPWTIPALLGLFMGCVWFRRRYQYR